MLKKLSRKSDEDSAEKGELAPADSLDRLADFTRRIVAVPRSEVSPGRRVASRSPKKKGGGKQA